MIEYIYIIYLFYSNTKLKYINKYIINKYYKKKHLLYFLYYYIFYILVIFI